MYAAEFFSIIKLVEANVLFCPLYVSPLHWNYFTPLSMNGMIKIETSLSILRYQILSLYL